MDLRIHKVRESIIKTINDSGLPATVVCYILNELLVQANEVKISSIKEQEEQERRDIEEQQRQEQIRKENTNVEEINIAVPVSDTVCNINDPSSCTTNVDNIDYDKTAIIEA